MCDSVLSYVELHSRNLTWNHLLTCDNIHAIVGYEIEAGLNYCKNIIPDKLHPFIQYDLTSWPEADKLSVMGTIKFYLRVQDIQRNREC
jgi:hypothetical protein